MSPKKEELVKGLVIKTAFVFIGLVTSTISYVLYVSHNNSTRLSIIESNRFTPDDALAIYKTLAEAITTLTQISKSVDRIQSEVDSDRKERWGKGG